MLNIISRVDFKDYIKSLDEFNKLTVTAKKIENSKNTMRCTRNRLTMILYINEFKMDMNTIQSFLDQSIKQYIMKGQSVKYINIMISEDNMSLIQKIYKNLGDVDQMDIIDEHNKMAEVMMKFKVFYELVSFYKVDLSTPGIS